MSSGADRMRQTRQRRAAGRLLLTIEVAELELAHTLVRHGMLDPLLADEPSAIARAIERTLEALIAESTLRATPPGGEPR